MLIPAELYRQANTFAILSVRNANAGRLLAAKLDRHKAEHLRGVARLLLKADAK